MRRAALIGSLALFLLASACSGGGSNSNGVVNVILWHGYEQPSEPGAPPNYEVIALNRLVAQFNRTHPKIHVQAIYCCTNDDALAKLTVAMQGNKQPDIAYEYGSSMPQLATAPKIVDLTSRVQAQSYDWNDFFPGERAVTEVDGKVLGVPALVDNLAVVYSKKLFDQAGLSYPSADWTWDDFRAAAKALTNPATKQFGMAFPADATEDTVWHYEAMLWEAGGDILTPDNKRSAFNSAPGMTALTMLQDLAVTDKSMFVDVQNSGKADTLFNSGKIGMVITGPWELASYPDVSYGVQIMPSFPGGNHQTISGPDNWVMFDNGQTRVDAAWTFLQWFTSSQQVLTDSLADGHLPTRESVVSMAAFSTFATKYPDIDVFAQNLSNVQKARPQIQAYPKVSAVLGQAIVSVLLGQSQPADALASAQTQADAILAAPQ